MSHCQKHSIRHRLNRVASAFLAAGLVALTVSWGPEALAVRRGGEDDGFGGGGFSERQTPQVPSMALRTGEFMRLAAQAPLAPLIPRMIEFRSVNFAGEVLRTPEQKAIAFLDRAADVLIAQFPVELALELRRMYFYDAHVKVSHDLWRESDGHRTVSGRFLKGASFQVEIAEQIASMPILLRIEKLVAMIEVGQSEALMRANPGIEYRYLFPVLDTLSRITSWLLVDEILTQFHPRLILAEIERAPIEAGIKAALSSDFVSDDYLDERVREASLLGGDIKGEKLVQWVKAVRDLREKKTAALHDEAKAVAGIEKALRLKLASEAGSQLFKISAEARSRGDERLATIARDLIRRPLMCEELF